MDVLVAARDLRVRRALSGLLELAGWRIVGAAPTVSHVPDLDARVLPGVVVLELDRRDDQQDLGVVEQLVRRGRCVIVVCSGSTRSRAVLAAGATACLDKDDARFTDRLTEAVQSLPGRPGGRPREHIRRQD
jgi:AmiR/NasT family two-component response regulator